MQTLTFQTQTREDTRLAPPADELHPLTFDEVVRLHQPQVSRLAHRLLGWRDRDGIEDVVQDVFLIALRRLPGFRGDSSLGTWLMGITVNACRARRRRAVLRLDWLRHAWEVRNDTHHRPADDDTAQQVRDAVAKLPARDREVIVLFYLEELPMAEIAKLLDAKPNAIEVRLHRARQRLKVLLNGLIGD